MRPRIVNVPLPGTMPMVKRQGYRYCTVSGVTTLTAYMYKLFAKHRARSGRVHDPSVLLGAWNETKRRNSGRNIKDSSGIFVRPLIELVAMLAVAMPMVAGSSRDWVADRRLLTGEEYATCGPARPSRACGPEARRCVSDEFGNKLCAAAEDQLAKVVYDAVALRELASRAASMATAAQAVALMAAGDAAMARDAARHAAAYMLVVAQKSAAPLCWETGPLEAEAEAALLEASKGAWIPIGEWSGLSAAADNLEAPPGRCRDEPASLPPRLGHRRGGTSVHRLPAPPSVTEPSSGPKSIMDTPPNLPSYQRAYARQLAHAVVHKATGVTIRSPSPTHHKRRHESDVSPPKATGATAAEAVNATSAVPQGPTTPAVPQGPAQENVRSRVARARAARSGSHNDTPDKLIEVGKTIGWRMHPGDARLCQMSWVDQRVVSIEKGREQLAPEVTPAETSADGYGYEEVGRAVELHLQESKSLPTSSVWLQRARSLGRSRSLSKHKAPTTSTKSVSFFRHRLLF